MHPTAGVTDAFSWRARVRGCLLGGALGDALGAPFEGQPEVSTGSLDRVVSSARELRWTDDTALQLAVASYLVELEHPRHFDDQAHARALAVAWRQDPDRGYGANPPRIFGTVLAGGDWRAAATGSFGGAGSLGNGGAMRAAPIGALSDDHTMVAALARRSAAVTHAHPVGQDGAAAIAVAASIVLRMPGDRPVDAAELAAQCVASLETATVQEAVAAVPATLGLDEPAETGRLTGNGVVAHEAVAAALSAFLHHPDDPLEAIAFAVRMGGDTDTIAAMAGSIGGAAAGISALPERLLDRLEQRARIERVADDLARRTQPP